MQHQRQGHPWEPQRQASPAHPVHQGHVQAYPPPLYHPSPPAHSYGPYYPSPCRHSQAGPSRGRDYLLSLHTDMSNLALNNIQPVQHVQPVRPVLPAQTVHNGYHQRTNSSPRTDKPLPRLPPPPLPPRPSSTGFKEEYRRPPVVSAGPSSNGQAALTDSYPVQQPTQRPHGPPSSPLSTSGPPRPPTIIQSTPPRQHIIPSRTETPPKAFRPTKLAVPRIHESHSEPRLSRPSKPTSAKAKGDTPTRKTKSQNSDPIYVPGSDSESDSSLGLPSATTTRRKRATSELASSASRPARTHAATPKKNKAKSTLPSNPGIPGTPRSASVKCAGYTRKGAPCQRLVKVAAPYLSVVDPNTEEERLTARYCKDHAGMICTPKGFYWRTDKESNSVWIEFADFIPEDLGQQTQALLRTTMESALTDKEAPGFLYAYELRDRQTATATFFKVGRTDNVPRRMGEWTTRCRSHAPTLRDIFPLSTSTPGMSPSKNPDGGLHRNPTLPMSYLPGAFRQTTNPSRTCPAVKRWERLVHLELADRSSTAAPAEYASLKERCDECQAVHREIFPLANEERVYEDTVMEIICRWERFVRNICSS